MDGVTRGAIVVDVLVADHAAQRVVENLRSRTMVAIGSGTHAPRRTINARIQIAAGRNTTASVPSPFGAVILRADASQTDSGDRERHLQDAALLLAIIEDPYAAREQFAGSDRARLQTLRAPFRTPPLNGERCRPTPAPTAGPRCGPQRLTPDERCQSRRYDTLARGRTYNLPRQASNGYGPGMDPTVVVAALGFATTLVGVWLTARFQQRSDRAMRILEARLRIYGECSDSLFEYSRATYDRVRSRLHGRPEVERDEIRQEAYRCNARVRSAIGQAYILTGDSHLEVQLSKVRQAIGDYNVVGSEADLLRRQSEVYSQLNSALEAVRSQLAS